VETCATPEDDDCDGETNESGAECVCTPLGVLPCYTGAPGTEMVPPCAAGSATCNDQGTALGVCMNEVVPAPELNDGVDNDCNGVADDPFLDVDLDGFTPLQGDCNDARYDVGPAAWEFQDNLLDDDCDGSTDELEAACDTSTLSATNPFDVANAMNLCGSPLVNAEFGGVGAGLAAARRIVTQFGTNVAALNRPSHGGKMVLLSTGRADTSNHDSGTAFDGTLRGACAQSLHPSPQGDPGACGAADPATVCDLVELRLTLRVPTNARSFSYQFQFWSSEYPTFRCTTYDDTFLALLTTSVLPPETNVSTGPSGEVISVNTGFLDICLDDFAGAPRDINGNGTVTAGEVVPTTNNCSIENGSALAATGYVFDNDATNNGVPDLAGSQSVGAGATTLLTSFVPVQPGELITLRFLIFEEGDDALDSSVVLDNFQWGEFPVPGPVTQQ